MKKIFYLFITLLLTAVRMEAQENDNHPSIKLYISQGWMSTTNVEKNIVLITERLYKKVTQLVTQTGIAEVGYSSFLVEGKFDVLSTSVSQAGVSKVYLAECEIGLYIKRTSAYGASGAAVFNSLSKPITGSGSTKDEAIINALSNLSAKDKEVITFLNASKAKIDDYYKSNCNEVMKQAAQMLALKDYEGSIALYFSVPSNAPCYNDAVDASQKVFITYIDDQCSKRLVKLKAYVALAQTENGYHKNYYDSAMNIMSNLNPSSDKCYIESMKEIEKIEKRLDEENKKQWDYIKQASSDTKEILKARYKAMGRISNGYQPPAHTNVIIAN